MYYKMQICNFLFSEQEICIWLLAPDGAKGIYHQGDGGTPGQPARDSKPTDVGDGNAAN
jgi:hypothetical protein